jgi:hypothetical protein
MSAADALKMIGTGGFLRKYVIALITTVTVWWMRMSYVKMEVSVKTACVLVPALIMSVHRDCDALTMFV